MILTRTFKHPAIGVSEKVFATFAKEWVGTEPYMILSDIISSYNLGELEKLEEVGELLKLFGTFHMEYELPHMEKHAKLKAVKLRAEEIPKRELHFGDLIWGATTDDEEQTF